MMKNLSIAFVAVLSLAAASGCKKKGGDCDGAINGAMDRMMADSKKDMDKLPPEVSEQWKAEAGEAKAP